MKILNKKIKLDEFFELLATSRQSFIFLDYDGTLAPFHIDPMKAFPYPGIEERLNQLLKSDTKVVILTGRAIKDFLPMIKLDTLPDIWGSHGGEYLINGEYQQFIITQNQKTGLYKAVQAAVKYLPETRCEQKPISIAAHWRGFEEKKIEAIKSNIINSWSSIADQHELEIHFFDQGIELRPLGISKAIVVHSYLDGLSSNEMLPIAYLGDDNTDEEAFEALGSKGLKVFVRNNQKSTLADVQIQPPDELLDFLDKWIQKSRKKDGFYAA